MDSDLNALFKDVSGDKRYGIRAHVSVILVWRDQRDQDNALRRFACSNRGVLRTGTRHDSGPCR